MNIGLHNMDFNTGCFKYICLSTRKKSNFWARGGFKLDDVKEKYFHSEILFSWKTILSMLLFCRPKILTTFFHWNFFFSHFYSKYWCPVFTSVDIREFHLALQCSAHDVSRLSYIVWIRWSQKTAKKCQKMLNVPTWAIKPKDKYWQWNGWHPVWNRIRNIILDEKRVWDIRM